MLIRFSCAWIVLQKSSKTTLISNKVWNLLLHVQKVFKDIQHVLYRFLLSDKTFQHFFFSRTKMCSSIINGTIVPKQRKPNYSNNWSKQTLCQNVIQLSKRTLVGLYVCVHTEHLHPGVSVALHLYLKLVPWWCQHVLQQFSILLFLCLFLPGLHSPGLRWR